MGELSPSLYLNPCGHLVTSHSHTTTHGDTFKPPASHSSAIKLVWLVLKIIGNVLKEQAEKKNCGLDSCTSLNNHNPIADRSLCNSYYQRNSSVGACSLCWEEIKGLATDLYLY